MDTCRRHAKLGSDRTSSPIPCHAHHDDTPMLEVPGRVRDNKGPTDKVVPWYGATRTPFFSGMGSTIGGPHRA